MGFVLDLDESRLGSELESDHWDSDKMETESGLDWAGTVTGCDQSELQWQWGKNGVKM